MQYVVADKYCFRLLKSNTKIYFVQEVKILTGDKIGIGQNIQRARKARGLTQKEVAGILEITERQYQNYEGNRSEPNIKTLLALADLFSVTTDYLLGREK